MNVLEKILEEIEEKFKTADAEKCDCEELCDVEDWYDSGYIDGQLSAHEKCMDIIRSHMDEAKDINVPSNDGWIPVEERLPEHDYETVLCVDAVDYYFVAVYTKKDGFRTEDFGADYENIIAWQPLPEPYRLKEQNDGE